MSDKPQGPGWWLASDGTWHPPELHPSIRVDDRRPGRPTSASPVPVPAPRRRPAAVPTRRPPGPADARAGASRSLPGAARRSATWSGESDRRPEAGPMFPDLFQQAVAGSAAWPTS